MDFEQNNNNTESPPNRPPAPDTAMTAGTAKKRAGWPIFWGIVITMSILANIAMFLMLIGVIAAFATTHRDVFREDVIQKGPRTNKIAVIDLNGIIDSRQAEDITYQLKMAQRDRRIKGLIIRVNSPGGTVSASDQIHNEILKYRRKTNKPVVAFMQGVAASGGYYSSVACDRIIAEPTTITGSIGVIMAYLVLEELLEGKLGIQPVVIKSGLRKDWPSSFQAPTAEQLEYLQEKVIAPVYERFVKIVDEGRKELTLADVRRIADGSIYPAQEALDEKLIDKIDYLDGAIKEVLSLAGIKDAQVIEYQKPFSWAGFLTSQSQSILKIDRAKIYEFGTPEVLYLWSVY